MAKVRIVWTDDEFIEKFNSSSTLRELQEKLGFSGHGGISNNRVKSEIERLQLDSNKFKTRTKKTPEEIRKRNSEYQAKWYSENKDSAFKARIKYKKEIRQIKRDFVIEYLSTHPCIDCGEDDILVLEFDHVGKKNFTIGQTWQLGHSLETLKKEIELCEVCCANCHKKKTANQLGWFKAI